MSTGRFPNTRLRRTRRTPWLRGLVRETRLTAAQLIQPVFVAEGKLAGPVKSLPGISRMDLKALVKEARALHALGLPAIALFPAIPARAKDDAGSAAHDEQGLVPRAIAAVKDAVPDLGVIVDVALDPYTRHGHDGILGADGQVDNDATVAALTRQALVCARAGADVLAPSDMMDGRIGAIRTALERDGQKDVLLLSYAAKYASSLYGPFRDAVGSKAALKGDKRGYQMDFANTDEALREVALDLDEGADLVMVKPGLPYLDVIHRVKERFGVPVLAYHVSGEYAMVHAAAAKGWLDRDAAMMESLLCLRRAGADAVITYFAKAAATLLDSAG